MKRNLIVNYLPPKLSQDDVKALFCRIGAVTKCKLVRNNTNGDSLGYAFVEYPSEDLASNAIKQINGIEMEGKTLKVSYARQSSPETKNTNVYVASLPPSVTEDKLLALFSKFGNILTNKLLTNPDGSSRGAGFVRYTTNSEALTAIDSMSGKTLPDSNGPLTVKLAIPPASKQNTNMGISTSTISGIGGAVSRNTNIHLAINQNMNSNATIGGGTMPPPLNNGLIGQPASVYVYGLQPTHTELTLYELFSPFGGVLNVKLIRDLTKEDKLCKGYGFVNFTKYEDAYKAVNSMNNVPFEDKVLQVSFKQNKAPGTGQTMNMTPSLNQMVSVKT